MYYKAIIGAHCHCMVSSHRVSDSLSLPAGNAKQLHPSQEASHPHTDSLTCTESSSFYPYSKKQCPHKAVYMTNENEYSTYIPAYMQPCILRVTNSLALTFPSPPA